MREVLRSRTGIAAGALLSLCLMAFSATAQTVDKDAGKDDTVKIHVTGDVVLDYAYRSRELTTFIGSGLDNLFGAAVNDQPNGEGTVEGYAAINVTAELSDNITVEVEVGTKGVDNFATLYYGGNSPGTTPVTGAAETIVLREANIRLNEFLMKELSVQLGMTQWSFNPRGKGGALVFDPRTSSSWAKNAFDGVDGAFTLSSNLLDEMETMGAVVTYTRENLSLDIVLLPAIQDFGVTDYDEALYAVDFMYKLDDAGSQIGAIAAVTQFDGRTSGGFAGGSETNVLTIGGGVALNGLMQGVELYGEVYFQTGTAGQDGADADVDAGGLALRVGGQWTMDSSINPTIGAEITMYSGDDDGTDGDVDRFMSYESVNDLMIIEDMYWGFDIDSNYMAIKINGGVSLSVAGGQNNLDLTVMLGFVTAQEDYIFVVGVTEEDAIGNEIDIKASWHLNSQVSLNAGVAFLVGSDILEEAMGGAGNSDSDDSATLFSLGVAASF